MTIRGFAPSLWCASLAAMLALSSGCSLREQVDPNDTEPGGQPLGVFTPDLPMDATEQAWSAFERDAWRREHRFRDAADPGYLFRSTRVSQSALARGAWSPAEIYELGAQLFHHRFRAEEGFGAGDLPTMSRFHFGLRGGPDSRRCASCHWRGGIAGAGDAADNTHLQGDGDSQASTLARNPIALSGAGYVEILAREMNEELAETRASLTLAAGRTGKAQRGPLMAKGISFGFATIRPDGTLDASELEGIDDDLQIKPFGWKGNVPTIRDQVEDALLVHHGMQSDYLVQTAPRERIGRFAFERPHDPDGDGVVHEITEGQVSVLTLFIAMQELPQIELPNVDFMPPTTWAEGQRQFESLGCATCHTPSLPLSSTTFELASRYGGEPLTVDLATHGAEPRIEPETDGGHRLYLFSDMKRHDMGPELAEKFPDRGTPGNMYITRRLWGLNRSRPYLHDARAPTIIDAIELHGGEAAAARDAYLSLSPEDTGPLRVYLNSLTRQRRIEAF